MHKYRKDGSQRLLNPGLEVLGDRLRRTKSTSGRIKGNLSQNRCFAVSCLLACLQGGVGPLGTLAQRIAPHGPLSLSLSLSLSFFFCFISLSLSLSRTHSLTLSRSLPTVLGRVQGRASRTHAEARPPPLSGTPLRKQKQRTNGPLKN